MIPSFSEGGVLPPFQGGDVIGVALPRSPYVATMSELVDHLGTSVERLQILRGLITYRSRLREVGFADGFQWFDGSFVENCEVVRGRPPKDIDVVSLLKRPLGMSDDLDAWSAFVDQHDDDLFNHPHIKATLKCDAYFIDLDEATDAVAKQTAYWFGLFSHQRDSFRWKGMLEVPFISDDAEAKAKIDEGLGDEN